MINSETPLEADVFNQLRSKTKIAVGLNCITKMIKYIGEIPNMKKPILIAHNGKGFDVWLILQEME